MFGVTRYTTRTLSLSLTSSGVDLMITGERWCQEACIRNSIARLSRYYGKPFCLIAQPDDALNHFEPDDNGGVRRIGAPPGPDIESCGSAFRIHFVGYLVAEAFDDVDDSFTCDQVVRERLTREELCTNLHTVVFGLFDKLAAMAGCGPHESPFDYSESMTTVYPNLSEGQQYVVNNYKRHFRR